MPSKKAIKKKAVKKKAAKKSPIPTPLSEPKKLMSVFEGGATRSILPIRYELLPEMAIIALARRLTVGAEKHGENNWRKGGEGFRRAAISHLMSHLLGYMEHGNRFQLNTDAIICNAAFLCHFEVRNPYQPRAEVGTKIARASK